MVTREVSEIAANFRERDAADPEPYPAANIAALYGSSVVQGPLPEHLGGKGWSLRQSVDAVRTIASQSPSTALVVSMPIGLAGGCFATDPALAPPEWRDRWREQIQWAASEYRAQRLFAACNSEKGAGGALAAISTVATRSGTGFQLNGEKILASGGRHASWFFSTAKVAPADIPGAGVVEFFLMPTAGQGVDVRDDWDGFGMRSTESQTVRYKDAPAHALLAFPDLINTIRPLQYWFCLFAAIPLGCARGIIDALATPAPALPALRLRIADAVMRYEAIEAYLQTTSDAWSAGADAAYAGRVLRTKTHVTMEAAKLCAELFSLSGGRHYRRNDYVARLLADSFAGTALRPPLALALETMVEQFEDVVMRA
ncbi:MAG: acyl-CoA dehydrogenase family protein [Dehalococcoidia bacterium]